MSTRHLRFHLARDQRDIPGIAMQSNQCGLPDPGNIVTCFLNACHLM
jgi:hypothetical protein